MEVKTATPELERNRAQLTELLLVDQPPVDEDPKEIDDRRQRAARARAPLRRRSRRRRRSRAATAAARTTPTRSSPSTTTRASSATAASARATTSRATTSSAARARATTTRIAFDLNDPMGESSCVTCGECVAACPTGALTNKPINNVPIRPREELRQVDIGLPVLRRRLRADLQRRRRAQGDRLRRGPPAAGLAEPPVRQGPLRLGLLVLQAAPRRRR